MPFGLPGSTPLSSEGARHGAPLANAMLNPSMRGPRWFSGPGAMEAAPSGIVRTPGFPVTVDAAPGSGNAILATVSPANAGDLVICTGRLFGATLPAFTGMSGGNVSGWTTEQILTDATHHAWFAWGVATAAGTTTISMNFDGPVAGLNTEVVVDSFTAGLGPTTSWRSLTSAQLVGSTATFTPLGPSLTYSGAPPDVGNFSMYYGLILSSQQASAGGAAGFTWFQDPGHFDQTGFETGLVDGTTYQPSETTVNSGTYNSMAAIFYVGAAVGVNLTAGDTIPFGGDTAVIGPDVFARTASDPIAAFSDAATTQRVYARTASDSLGAVTDAATEKVGQPRTASDPLGAVTDAATKIQVYARTATDPLGAVTDAATRITGRPRTSADTITFSPDTATQATGKGRSATDTITFSPDAATRIVGQPRTSVDTITFSPDVAGKRSAFARSTADALGSVTDSSTRLAGQPRSAGDAITATDAVIAKGGTTKTAVDTVAFSDAATRTQLGISKTSTDTIIVSDADTRVLHSVRAAADAITESDSATPTVGRPRTSTDTITVSDNAASLKGTTKTAVDTITFSESANRGLLHYVRTGTDTITASDAATRAQPRARTASDTITFSESMIAGRTRTANDTITASDVASRAPGSRVRAANDVVVFSDQARAPHQVVHAFDVITFSDVAADRTVKPRTASDNITVSDAADAVVVYTVGVPTILGLRVETDTITASLGEDSLVVTVGADKLTVLTAI